MNKKTLALPAVLVLLLVLSVGSVFGFRYLVSAPTSNPEAVSLTIEKGESVTQIADKLEKAGLIRNAFIYRLFVRLSGFEGRLQAGNFQLSRNLPMKELTYSLTRGTTDQTVTTLEGWRIEEVAEYFDSKKVVSRDEFLEAAGSAKFNYDFLPSYDKLDQPYRRLEGYLFPDTYKIAAQSSAETIINVMLRNFSSRVTSQMRADAAKNKISLAETINLASIVEREAAKEGDRAIVAGILLKRLQTPGWRLEADATLQYGLGYDKGEKTWWKRGITEDDLKSGSAYNSRLQAGLPPTPISSPGISSIKAAIYPQATEYWYYINDPTGAAHYAKTLEEHNANVQKYLR